MLVNDGNKHFIKDRISKLRDNIYNLSGRGERKICFNIHCSLTRNQKRKSARKLSAMDSVDFVVVEAAVVVVVTAADRQTDLETFKAARNKSGNKNRRNRPLPSSSSSSIRTFCNATQLPSMSRYFVSVDLLKEENEKA